MTASSPQPRPSRPATKRQGDLGGRPRLGGGGSNTLLLILTAAVAAFVLRHAGGGDGQTDATPTPVPSTISTAAFGPAVVTPSELSARASSSGYPGGFPLYWAGEVAGTELELTVLDDGTWAVRYLPAGASAGATNDVMTIATFYQPDGASRVTAIAEQTGAKSKAYSNGAIAASESETANAISFAFPEYPALVVVTSTNPASAWQLIDAGAIKPIGE